MLHWYGDANMAIFFESEKPKIEFRYPSPDLSDEENEKINEKPFLLKNDVRVTLYDLKKKQCYSFSIDAGYTWDGASIPWVAWRIIGSKTDSRFAIPSFVHDVLCENKAFVNYDRYFADKVFERLLYVSKVPAAKRWAMFHCVDNLQKFQGWKKAEEQCSK